MNHTQENNTLLILDDDPNTLKSLQRLLSPAGYDIHCFSRPFDAAEMLPDTDIGVIITDQCMPQMDGDKFLLLANRFQPEAEHIVISGYIDQDIKQRASTLDACSYLAKPWDDDELRQTVASAFARFNH